jgi:hypothetical protein
MNAVTRVILVTAAIPLAGFALYLIFLIFVIVFTKKTEGLRDVAEAISAFPLVRRLNDRNETANSHIDGTSVEVIVDPESEQDALPDSK